MPIDIRVLTSNWGVRNLTLCLREASPSRLNLLCSAELIAWFLRRPERAMLTGLSIFLTAAYEFRCYRAEKALNMKKT